MKEKRTLLNYCGLLGIVSLLSYTAAVVFSPLAYPGYNWMAQAVSDLSAANAPSLALWDRLSSLYNACELLCVMMVCIGSAASRVKEFYLLPVGKELLRYDTLAVNTIVKNRLGEVSSCDVPYSDDLARFNSDYLRLTRHVAEDCKNHDLTESMVIGTSAIIDTELDGAVGMNSGIFNNPFIIWGRYHRGLLKTTLTMSFQFHHTQMDGAHAGRFLALVQENIRTMKI